MRETFICSRQSDAHENIFPIRILSIIVVGGDADRETVPLEQSIMFSIIRLLSLSFHEPSRDFSLPWFIPTLSFASSRSHGVAATSGSGSSLQAGKRFLIILLKSRFHACFRASKLKRFNFQTSKSLQATLLPLFCTQENRKNSFTRWTTKAATWKMPEGRAGGR